MNPLRSLIMDTYQTLPRLLINSFLLFAFAVSPLLVAATTNAASPQAQNALANNPALEYAPDSVLVKFNPAASRVQKLNAHAQINAEKIRGYGLVKGLEHMQLGKGQGVERAIEILQQLPFVEYAEPDYVLRADTNDTFYGLQWRLKNTGQAIRGTPGIHDADIDAPEAWSLTTGDPAFIVAVIDTGVEYTHEDLANNIWVNPGEIPDDKIDNDGNGFNDDVHGWDFYRNDNDPMDLRDGHGTHVSGTICAEANNGIGVSGVAWHCNIMALRFIGPFGGYTSDAIAALNYAVDKGVKVSNNSWGGGGYSQALYDAIQNAGNSGHLFVTAAGNGGQDSVGDNTDIAPHYPSSYDLGNIIAVAATDNQDRLAGFSNYGLLSVDLGAPGVDIASTMLSGYYWSSGTSMAAPHVTGVAALISDLHPELTLTEIKDRILNTVRPIDAHTGKTVSGGVVNAYAALTGGVCGDGTLDAGETCDDGAANGTTICGCQADCTFAAEGISCADAEYCNGVETCDGTGACQAGAVDYCDDGIGCTDDSCDEINDTCVNAANDANCPDDELFCTGVEYCDTVTDCSSTGNPCREENVCNEDTESCDQAGSCGDGTLDAGETCDDGAANGTTTCGCQSGCTYAPAATSCADGLYCNGDETCDGTGACQAGTTVTCDDGVGCTDDSCDEVNDTCVNAANDANCADDGLFCTGTEFCDALNDCSSTGDPCLAGETCNDVDDMCDSPACTYNDKGTCNADPSCEWIGHPKNGRCDNAGSCVPDETPEETCDDGVDNDCDGMTDCADAVDCNNDSACTDTACDTYQDRKSCQAAGDCTWSNSDKVCR
jgi:subtilisin family serine protease